MAESAIQTKRGQLFRAGAPTSKSVLRAEPAASVDAVPKEEFPYKAVNWQVRPEQRELLRMIAASKKKKLYELLDEVFVQFIAQNQAHLPRGFAPEAPTDQTQATGTQSRPNSHLGGPIRSAGQGDTGQVHTQHQQNEHPCRVQTYDNGPYLPVPRSTQWHRPCRPRGGKSQMRTGQT